MKNNVIRTCKRCGFILGTRPGLGEVDGVCSACINHDKRRSIDFTKRQEWLTPYIEQNRTNPDYDCLVAVSGGKDSTTIVRKLFESHGVKRALLVRLQDEFTPTQAGQHNIDNLSRRFNVDLLNIRLSPKAFIEHTLSDFTDESHPLKWFEQQITSIPVEMARRYNIKLVFYGENPSFEYGSAETLEVFHPTSNEQLQIIYMGAIYPYSDSAWRKTAAEVGFLDLNHFNEWQRQGQIENYTQQDSIGYVIHIWTKFVKFGFQRVSDMACRWVRDGLLTREQAMALIRERDYICDPAAKRDFCNTLGITERYFDDVVDKHANMNLVVKDINGIWRRRDLI